jgi:hypothetical protein
LFPLSGPDEAGFRLGNVDLSGEWARAQGGTTLYSSNIIERFTIATSPGSQNGLSLAPGNRATLTSGRCDVTFMHLAAT